MRLTSNCLRSVIVGDSNPENVILLEIEPEKQKTRIDFACTETLLGVRPVCLTKIRKRGAQLFYERDGREVRIERIYNRVIFDELHSAAGSQSAVSISGRARREMGRASELVFPNQQTFAAVSENGAHVAGVFCGRISRRANRSMIMCSSRFIRSPGWASTWSRRRKNSRALEKPHEWILQKKVTYAEFVPTVDGRKSKAEIRMMFVWPDGRRSRCW